MRNPFRSENAAFHHVDAEEAEARIRAGRGGDEILVLPGDGSLVERLRERLALPVKQLD